MAVTCYGLISLILSLGPLRVSGLAPLVFVDQPILDLPAGRYRADRLQVQDGSRETILRLRGVQYAEDPVADLRWRPPVPIRPSAGVVNATEFGADCIQAHHWYKSATLLDGIGLTTKTSEACLFLNVWAPEVRGPRKLPVLFWIHGGSFVAGGTTDFNGDGVMAYRRGAIYVTANYRLGALGFLGGRTVASGSGDGSAGNFGLQDTREALRWVRRNIASLGGDPARVTIFGESSGASLVETHMVSPRSFGLFSGAVLQSGPFDNSTVQDDPEESFRAFVSQTPCNKTLAEPNATMACLRQVPLFNYPFLPSLMAAVAKSGSAGYFSPAIDGVELTDTPEVLAAKGLVAPLQGVIIGVNLNEGNYMLLSDNPVPGAPWCTEEQLHGWIRGQYPHDVKRIMARYPPNESEGRFKYWSVASKIYTDTQYFCPARRSAHWLLQSKRVSLGRIFFYQLTYEPSYFASTGVIAHWYYWCNLLPCEAMGLPFGAAHGADVSLVWAAAGKFNATDATLAKRMIAWWQQFAENFDPADSGGARWLTYGPNNSTLLLQPEPSMASGLQTQLCDFWDELHRVPYTKQRVSTARSFHHLLV